jgi:hypothetical protein
MAGLAASAVSADDKNFVEDKTTDQRNQAQEAAAKITTGNSVTWRRTFAFSRPFSQAKGAHSKSGARLSLNSLTEALIVGAQHVVPLQMLLSQTTSTAPARSDPRKMGTRRPSQRVIHARSAAERKGPIMRADTHDGRPFFKSCGPVADIGERLSGPSTLGRSATAAHLSGSSLLSGQDFSGRNFSNQRT